MKKITKTHSNLKEKTTTIFLSILASATYYYACIYIPYYILSFDLINIDKYPEQWKWSPSILTLIASLNILCLSFLSVQLFNRKNNSIEDNSKNKNAIQLYLLLTAIIGGFFFVLIQEFTVSLFTENYIERHTKTLEFWLVPALITNAIIYPISEELFFRKIILKAILLKFNQSLSVLISSILFSLIHYPNYQQILVTSIGGVILALFYLRGRNIIYPVAFHISWNTTVIIMNYNIA